MKKPVMLLAVTLLALLVVSALWWSRDMAPAASPVLAAATPATAPTAVTRAVAANPPVAPPVVQSPRDSVPVPAVIDQSAPAAETMAAAREHGDPRTPDLTRVRETDQPPTAAEMADPKLYQAYEKRQALRGYASYVSAVDKQVPQEQALLDKARAMGMPPEEVARAEEKIRMMQAARDQVLADHPDLSR